MISCISLDTLKPSKWEAQDTKSDMQTHMSKKNPTINAITKNLNDQNTNNGIHNTKKKLKIQTTVTQLKSEW